MGAKEYGEMRKIKIKDFIPIYGLGGIMDIHETRRYIPMAYAVWHTAWILAACKGAAELLFWITEGHWY